MGLTSKYTVAAGRLPDLFAKIRDGQAPELLTQQLFKDWGFTSSNDRAMLPMLKELGFLSPDGKPTTRYHDYRDHSRSKAVMADALRAAYSDIFLIKEHPTDSDKEAIQGKFKSFHNTSDNVAQLMTKNFFTLLQLSDLKARSKAWTGETERAPTANSTGQSDGERNSSESPQRSHHSASLHYNIQIHLPPTKDVEVYNAIFKSLREHILER